MKKLKLEELGRISAVEYKETAKTPVVILLDNVRSLHNVGSTFRSADGFLVEKIVLAGITGTPPNREIQKTALGATESVPWEYAEDAAAAAKQLQDSGYEIVVVEQTTESIPLHTFVPSRDQKYTLVFGNEVNGVSDSVVALADKAIEIPQGGSKHSLNVSVCVGIITWHFYEKLQLSRDI